MSGEQFVIARDELRSFIRRIENLEEEIRVLNGDKSDVYKEAKARGFDVKIMRKCVASRRIDASERSEQDAIYDLYMSVLDGAEETGTEVAIARAPAHATPAHDPETGEILESGSNAPAASSSRLTDAVPDESAVAYQESVGVQPAAFTSSAAHEANKSAAPILESVQSHEAAVVSEPAESSSDEISAPFDAGPQALAVPGGEPSIPSSDDDGAKMDGEFSRDPGQSGEEPGFHNVQSGQAAKSSLRPLCRHPGEDRCGGYGSVTCHSCLTAARESEAA